MQNYYARQRVVRSNLKTMAYGCVALARNIALKMSTDYHTWIYENPTKCSTNTTALSFKIAKIVPAGKGPCVVI